MLLKCRGVIPPFQEITTLFRIGRIYTCFTRDLRNDERKPSEWPGLQPPQERRHGVALVPRQAEAITEFVYSNPPFVGRILLHVRFEQFRDTGIFSHRLASIIFIRCPLKMDCLQDLTCPIRLSITAYTAFRADASACHRFTRKRNRNHQLFRRGFDYTGVNDHTPRDQGRGCSCFHPVQCFLK